MSAIKKKVMKARVKATDRIIEVMCVMNKEGRCGYSFNEDELIDSLYEACVTLKEEGVI